MKILPNNKDLFIVKNPFKLAHHDYFKRPANLTMIIGSGFDLTKQ